MRRLLVLIALVLGAATATAAQSDPAALIRQAQALLEQALALLQPPTTTIALPAGADLQAAYEAAAEGATLALAAGETYGPLVADRDAAITITTAGIAASEARVTPAEAAGFARLRGGVDLTGGQTVLSDLEIIPVSTRGDIVVCAAGSGYRLERVYLHGDPITGQKRGIAANCGAMTVTHSYISDIKLAGQDAQAIAGWDGAGPYTITDNYLEASGENVLFGGSDPSTPDLVPSDIVISGNTIAKPLAWRAQAWTVKNLVELKNARRVSVTDNTLDGSWTSGQVGFAVVLTPRNQDGGCPWCLVEDVTIAGNIITEVGGGFQILGTDYTHPSGPARRLTIADNQIAIDWSLGAGWAFQISDGPSDLVLRGNTTTIVTGARGILTFAGAPLSGFVVDGNTFAEGEYGIQSPTAALGTPTLDAYAPGYVWTGNTIVRGTSGRWIAYPEGTTVQ